MLYTCTCCIHIYTRTCTLYTYACTSYNTVFAAGGGGSNAGAIVGGILGGLALVALIVVVIFFTNKKYAWIDTRECITTHAATHGWSEGRLKAAHYNCSATVRVGARW